MIQRAGRPRTFKTSSQEKEYWRLLDACVEFDICKNLFRDVQRQFESLDVALRGHSLWRCLGATFSLVEL